MGEHYVYAHRRASDEAVFYVGKGIGRRAWSTSGRNSWWKHVSRKHGFKVEIVRSGLPECCALSLERATIAAVGRDKLVNLVDGGGGTSGWKHSDEVKSRIGAFHKGREITPAMRRAIDHANATRTFTAETRAKMSAAHKGRSYGPMSAETRAKISASHLGIRPSADALRKMSEAKIGKACGRNSPSYDHTTRHFHHPLHGKFVGTRGDLIAQFGLPAPCISALLSGRRNSVKGWTL